MREYDLVVIGSGAGLMIAQAAVRQGISCALIEKDSFGGTCLNRGCIPSKVLVHPADVIRESERAGRIGLGLHLENVDWQMIRRRVKEKIAENTLIEQRLRESSLDVYKGSASFVSRNELEIKSSADESVWRIKGKRIIIGAGARSLVPPVTGLAETGYLTSETFFGDRFPHKPWSSLIIVGGGAIGAEFAHVFSAVGTKVTVVEMQERLVPTEEVQISALLEAQFRANNIDVFTGSQAVAAAREDDLKQLTLKDISTGRTRLISADEIIIASGLKSNSDTLNLENCGVETDSRGWIITDEFLETSVPGIYALGDINGKFQFRHKANYEADILVHNLVSGSGEKRKASYSAVPWAIFTHPQIAHVGMTEEEALRTGRRIQTGKNYYSMVANGYAHGFNPGDPDDGFVKLIADDENKILGVHIIGPDAAILIQSFVYLMNAGFTCPGAHDQTPFSQQTGVRFCLQAGSVETIDQSMVIHPALSEVAAWVTGELEWIN